MPILLKICLFSTLVYLYATLDKAMYKRYVLKYIKIDLPLSVIIAAWSLYLTNSAILSLILLVLSILVQIAYNIANKTNNSTEFVNIPNVEQPKSPEIYLLDSVGQVTGKGADDEYWGNIYLRNSKLPKPILVYSEDEMEVGDWFQITGIDGTKIKAVKYSV